MGRSAPISRDGGLWEGLAYPSLSPSVSFWDWGEYDDFSGVIGLVAAFSVRVEIIFAYILVFPACDIEVQHNNDNSPTIFKYFDWYGYYEIGVRAP